MKKVCNFILICLILSIFSGCCWYRLLGAKSGGYITTASLKYYNKNITKENQKIYADCVDKYFVDYKCKYEYETKNSPSRIDPDTYIPATHHYAISFAVFSNNDFITDYTGTPKNSDSPTNNQYSNFVKQYTSDLQNNNDNLKENDKAILLQGLQEWTKIRFEQCGANVYTIEERCLALDSVGLRPDWCKK
ncbi:hypothetical protein [Desulfovibrio litoralis]|uniref:Lipoprotein n=1 Tax=Desulfovibrio litoralis DSM 11393 TaxID=1121455 RepID=A0A1M7SAT4_9BACT|nr:hypothetical protein [Desulfovibrio litoralis]SHN55620.1 hypothetical protein SAMN02745728_00697 [Desulfovibrio litoralis DSM 11393]